MLNIPLCGTLPLTDIFAKMPAEELDQTLDEFRSPGLLPHISIVKV